MNYKKLSKKQEKSVAKEVGGNTTIASGSLWFQKADVRNENFLFECKTTTTDNYTLNLNIWQRIQKQALKDNLREPALVIDYQKQNKRFVIVEHHLVQNSNLNVTKIDLGDFNKSKKLNINELNDLFIQNTEPNRIVSFYFKLNNQELIILDWIDFMICMEVV